LNDPWIRGSQAQQAELRLGNQMPWPDRVKAGRAFLAAIRPDVMSLQFVPYSFHPAGLNFALPQILRAIVGQLPVQTMFHELWTGAQIGAPPKVRIFGFCQRKIIQATIRKLACRVVHTSNLVYVHLLKECGIDVIHLPLFGAIPVLSAERVSAKVDDVLRLGMFGSIHPEWSPDEMFSQLLKLRRPILLSHIGRIGPGESAWADMTERYRSQIEFHRLGEESPENISRFLSSVDFGVATTPFALIGKSSSVAAMIDHGLPVIVTRNDVHFHAVAAEDPISHPLLIPLDSNFFARLKKASRRTPESRLPQVAAKFLIDIGAHSPGKTGEESATISPSTLKP
jgi:glycosyltransferase involved in cell wall biosynthesis